MGDKLVKIIDNDIKNLICSGRTYFDILIYNSYNKDSQEIDRNKLNTALDDLITTYSDLLSFATSLSGYQFVGLILEKNLALTESLDMKLAYFLLSVGFLISMFCILICFITIKYLRGIREEDVEFIIVGIHKYKNLFQSGNIILYLNCILFSIPINLLIYNSLDVNYGLVYNNII